ncbi:MAG: transposase [Pseudonocardiales bacterium]|nr:transposase [Pseudonocardiales bacterium]
MTYGPEVRRRVFDLVREGLSSRAVAEAAGVSRQAVDLWRVQAGGVIAAAGPWSGRYLDRDERYEMARLLESGLSVRAVAAALGRAPSTVSREARRNRSGRSGRYEPERAQSMALGRRARPKARKVSAHPPLGAWVQGALDRRLSPEQISGRLPVQFPDDGRMRISHEAIYQAIYVRPRGELRRTLSGQLRTGRAARRTQGSRAPRGVIQDAVPIRDRPEEVEGRLVPGHHEGDLIKGTTASNSAIGTLVERTTGHLSLLHLPDGHASSQVVAALSRAVAAMPAGLARSITWDRGSEMARHRAFTAATGVKVYFADPGKPQQRGSNENINGLLREYFAKGTDLSAHTAADLQAVADQLNDRPRKRLGFLTPNEVMHKLLTQDINEQGVATFT